VKTRSDFFSDLDWRNHLDFELGVAQRTGNKRDAEQVEKELAKLDGGPKKTGRPRKAPDVEQRA
jgi:hypothetical protein